jgi:hypothetical protein
MRCGSWTGCTPLLLGIGQVEGRSRLLAVAGQKRRSGGGSCSKLNVTHVAAVTMPADMSAVPMKLTGCSKNNTGGFRLRAARGTASSSAAHVCTSTWGDVQQPLDAALWGLVARQVSGFSKVRVAQGAGLTSSWRMKFLEAVSKPTVRKPTAKAM